MEVVLRRRREQQQGYLAFIRARYEEWSNGKADGTEAEDVGQVGRALNDLVPRGDPQAGG
jgi:hypothetical protein